jgi:hypothetical protein
MSKSKGWIEPDKSRSSLRAGPRLLLQPEISPLVHPERQQPVSHPHIHPPPLRSKAPDSDGRCAVQNPYRAGGGPRRGAKHRRRRGHGAWLSTVVQASGIRRHGAGCGRSESCGASGWETCGRTAPLRTLKTVERLGVRLSPSRSIRGWWDGAGCCVRSAPLRGVAEGSGHEPSHATKRIRKNQPLRQHIDGARRQFFAPGTGDIRHHRRARMPALPRAAAGDGGV